MSILARFCRDERGATSIEYALIAGMVSIVIVTALTSMGSRLNTKFAKVSNALGS